MTTALDTATPLTMVLVETTGEDSITYLHGLDLVAQSDGTNTEYFAYDGLGSVRQVVDEAAGVLLAQTYDPYGGVYASAGPGETHFGWTGEQVDASGLVYLRARYYSPLQGRFFQRDTWEGEPNRPQTLNPYMYGLGNPVLYTDPSGYCIFTGVDTLVCVGAGLTAFVVGATIGVGVGYGMYQLCLSGHCGCELQMWAESMTPLELARYLAMTGTIAGVLSAAGVILIPASILGIGTVAASGLAAAAAFQRIEEDPTNWCRWAEFMVLTLPIALYGLGILSSPEEPITLQTVDEAISYADDAASGIDDAASVAVRPLGFESEQQYQEFSRTLYEGLAEAGYDDAVVYMEGSSVSGESWDGAYPFDGGPNGLSDYDIDIASPRLMQRWTEEFGWPTRSSGRRTATPWFPGNYEALGLAELRAGLSAVTGRHIQFQGFDSANTIYAVRGPVIFVPR